MQFNRDSSGALTPLPKPSVDTGAGLERMAMILQNAETNYDTDLFQEIIQKTAKLSGISYDPKSPLAPSFRVIADHARATTFLISDGVMPSNEGRGYVLRRIMRRAIRHGKKLEFEKPFFAKVCGWVIDQMKEAYPELKDQQALIEKAVQAEEELFLKTLDKGLGLIAELMTETGKSQNFKDGKLNGEIAFKLYDTYGFPLDLTRVILEEKGLGVDEAGFQKAMEHQRSESRKNWKGSGEAALDEIFLKFAAELRAKNQLPIFTGYEKLEDEGTCIGLFEKTDQGFQPIQKFQANKNQPPLIAFFTKTPFYAESGGQVGDRGQVYGNGVFARVVDVTHPVPELIAAHIEILEGTIEVGKKYQQKTEALTRALTARNHTATHILHWALREVLGKHVKQAGSLVTPEFLRFDFSHFQPLTSEEIEKIELLINEKIWHGFPVIKKTMPKDQAISEGAIAFFGEKYGEEVRVVKVGDFSVELCGGTHVDQSSDIHLFKIESESGIAAGVRRIVARTSKGAFQMLRERSLVIDRIRENLKAGSLDDILVKLEKSAATEKELRKQIEKLEAQAARLEVQSLIDSAQIQDGIRIIAHVLKPATDGMKKLRTWAEVIQAQAPDAVAWLGIAETDGSRASLIALAGKTALKLKPSFSAQKVIQASAPLIAGKGGGKPDLAQAGGVQVSGLQAALDAARKAIGELLI
jgi:alanyl-tRNA synthetase